jgi:hypothetical protein
MFNPSGRVHPHSVIFRGFCSILFAARISEAAMGRAEVRGHNMINTRLSGVQRSIEGCDRWGEGRGILYFDASGGLMERYTPMAARVRA